MSPVQGLGWPCTSCHCLDTAPCWTPPGRLEHPAALSAGAARLPSPSEEPTLYVCKATWPTEGRIAPMSPRRPQPMLCSQHCPALGRCLLAEWLVKGHLADPGAGPGSSCLSSCAPGLPSCPIPPGLACGDLALGEGVGGSGDSDSPQALPQTGQLCPKPARHLAKQARHSSEPGLAVGRKPGPRCRQPVCGQAADRSAGGEPVSKAQGWTATSSQSPHPQPWSHTRPGHPHRGSERYPDESMETVPSSRGTDGQLLWAGPGTRAPARPVD